MLSTVLGTLLLLVDLFHQVLNQPVEESLIQGLVGLVTMSVWFTMSYWFTMLLVTSYYVITICN